MRRAGRRREQHFSSPRRLAEGWVVTVKLEGIQGGRRQKRFARKQCMLVGWCAGRDACRGLKALGEDTGANRKKGSLKARGVLLPVQHGVLAMLFVRCVNTLSHSYGVSFFYPLGISFAEV